MTTIQIALLSTCIPALAAITFYIGYRIDANYFKDLDKSYKLYEDIKNISAIMDQFNFTYIKYKTKKQEIELSKQSGGDSVTHAIGFCVDDEEHEDGYDM